MYNLSILTTIALLFMACLVPPAEKNFGCGTVSGIGELGNTSAKRGKELYRQNCAACHKMQGKLVGPPLLGIAQKRNRKWLQAFIRDSQKMIRRRDSLALALEEEYGHAQMNSFPNLTNDDIDSILAYTK